LVVRQIVEGKLADRAARDAAKAIARFLLGMLFTSYAASRAGRKRVSPP